jgi:murein DD-endopeptidase MepM/ murein hydrolase activator NlpD
MRPQQRPRTGRRRDDGVRRIRSNVEQRYPGVDLPAADDPTQPLSAVDGRLSPVLDTGLQVQTRVDRAQANADRRRRVLTFTSVGIAVALVVGVMVWRAVSDSSAAKLPLAVPTSSAKASSKAKPLATQASSAADAAAHATPIFAAYRKLELHLPVPMMNLTEIGFHQASYAWALPMTTTMKDANLTQVASTKTTGRNRAAEPSGPNAVMTGKVIRMWRARAGRPDTAADVGALAGTPVLSPVTGTIVRIKPYKLYGKYFDYEMHIIPDNTKHLDVVMIHLTDLTSKVGERVVAGVTPVAHIRKLSGYFHDQLADYTKSPGDHVHIQVNDSGYPHYRGLQGAVQPTDPLDISTSASD